MATSYDAIVIGAGVVGSSTAFHLAKAGLHRTLVLERDTVCSGNSRKSGALVRMHYTNLPEARLALASLRYFQHWNDLVGGECGFRNVGFVVLVDPANEQRLRRNVERLRGIGVNTQVVETVDLPEVQPGLTAQDGAVGAFEPESGYADPVATTRSFMSAAQVLGVTLREGVSVTGIRQRGGRVSGVASNEGDFEAPVVICAANVWSPPILRSVGLDLGIHAVRSQISFFERPALPTPTARVLLDLVNGGYSRPDGEGLYLVGGHFSGATSADPDNYNEENDSDFPEFARGLVRQRLPSIGIVPYARGHAGLYDMSPDTRAIIDRAPGVEGLYFAAGFSGTGFKISPIVGACLAELGCDGKAVSADLRSFRYSRFAENDPIAGPDEYELGVEWGHKF